MEPKKIQLKTVSRWLESLDAKRLTQVAAALLDVQEHEVLPPDVACVCMMACAEANRLLKQRKRDIITQERLRIANLEPAQSVPVQWIRPGDIIKVDDRIGFVSTCIVGPTKTAVHAFTASNDMIRAVANSLNGFVEAVECRIASDEAWEPQPRG